MTAERCETVQARLVDALLAREPPAPMDGQHAERCEACGAEAEALVGLSRALAADTVPEASDALAHVTLARARQALARRDAAHEAPAAGFRREVIRLLGAALLPLPLVLAWNAAVLGLGGELLGGLVPATLLRALGVGYVVAGVTWLACLYGSLPVLAHRQLHRPPHPRALEAAS